MKLIGLSYQSLAPDVATRYRQRGLRKDLSPRELRTAHTDFLHVDLTIQRDRPK